MNFSQYLLVVLKACGGDILDLQLLGVRQSLAFSELDADQSPSLVAYVGIDLELAADRLQLGSQLVRDPPESRDGVDGVDEVAESIERAATDAGRIVFELLEILDESTEVCELILQSHLVGLVWFILRPQVSARYDGYMDGRSQIEVHVHRRTDTGSQRLVLPDGHPSNNRGRRYLTSVNVPLS